VNIRNQTLRDPGKDGLYKDLSDHEILNKESQPVATSPRNLALSSRNIIFEPTDIKERVLELEVRTTHLQCLANFISTDLGYLLGLKLKIQDGSLESITF
jgi:hypothetical protein